MWDSVDGFVFCLCQEPLQIVRHVVKVSAGDEALLRFLQTITAQLDHLMLDESHDGYGVGWDGLVRTLRSGRRLWTLDAGVLFHEGLQPLLHLPGRL